MRLSSFSGEPVEYPRGSGIWYNNNSRALFIPIIDSITYETASRLLGMNGTYGFQLSITPTVKVSISEHQSNPLILKVEVSGPGFPLSGAALGYNLYRVYPTGVRVSIELLKGTA
jgi:hypothetical protein